MLLYIVVAIYGCLTVSYRIMKLFNTFVLFFLLITFFSSALKSGVSRIDRSTMNTDSYYYIEKVKYSKSQYINYPENYTSEIKYTLSSNLSNDINRSKLLSDSSISDNSIDLFISILKDSKKREELINQLEGLKVNKTDSYRSYSVDKNEKVSLEAFKEFQSLFIFLKNSLKAIIKIDVLFLNTYNDLKSYSSNLLKAVLGIPNVISSFISSNEFIEQFLYILISCLTVTVFMFVSYIVEQNISTYFINNYSQKLRGNKFFDKLIYIGIVLLTSFIPVVGSVFVVVILSLISFLLMSAFFHTDLIFMAVVVKFAVVLVLFRTLLIFVRKMLLVSFILNFWGYLKASYKDVRDLYIWFRTFLGLLFTFLSTFIIISLDNEIMLSLQLAVIKLFFIIFTIVLFIFLYRFKLKIQKGLTAFAYSTKYFYIKKLFNFLSKRFYILALIYVLVVLSSFILGNYSSLFYFLNATLFTIILIIVHHFLQYYGARYIKRFFSHRFVELVDELYKDNTNKRNLYANILGNPKLELLLEGVYYYAVFFIFFLFILHAWGINVLNFLRYIYQIPIIQPVTQIIVSFVLILAFTLLLLLSLRQRILYLIKNKRFTDINKTLSLLLLFKNIYILVCVILILVVSLKVFGVSVSTLIAITGIVTFFIAFGAKDIVRNFFNALVSILNCTFSVGDVVTIKSSTGTVEDITSSYVKIRDLQGKLHLIPFSEISTVINETKVYSYAYSTISISDQSDLSKVLPLLYKIGEELLEDQVYSEHILAPLLIITSYSINSASIDLTCKIKTLPGKQYSIKNEFTQRVKESLKKYAKETNLTSETIRYLIK